MTAFKELLEQTSGIKVQVEAQPLSLESCMHCVLSVGSTAD